MQAVNPDIKPSKPFLILVEGKTDQEMLYTALAHWQLDLPPYQVIAYNSKTKFKAFFNVLVNQTEFRQVTHLAVFRDADHHPAGALQSVKGQLQRHVPRIPKEAIPSDANLIKRNNDLAIGIFITPDSHEEGALENLLLSSLDDKLVQHIAAYVRDADDYMEQRLANRYCNTPKACTYAYTALFENENFRDSFKKKIWNWDHEAFAPLKRFFQGFS